MAVSPFYWIYGYGGRDVLALPSQGAPARRGAVRSIPAATLRSRAFRRILETFVMAGADRFAARRHFNPVPRFVGFDWRSFDARLTELLGCAFQVAVVQPPQGKRNRFYVHFFTPEGDRFAFAKVSVDERNDAQLKAEADILTTLQRTEFATFRYPKLLAAGTFGARQFLLLESLPPASRPAPAVWTPAISRVHREISGEPRRLGALQDCSWWPAFAARRDAFGPVATAVERDGAVDVAVCRAHGDFVNWNFHEHGGVRWLFDWESFSHDAPALGDELRFVLGLHTRAAVRKPAGVASLLFQGFGCEAADRRRELLRALAFLHAKDVTTATAVARAWPAACGLA